MPYLEYILQISTNVELEGHGNMCIKDPPSNAYLVSTRKASFPQSPNVQIASTRLVWCVSRGIPELSNNEEG